MTDNPAAVFVKAGPMHERCDVVKIAAPPYILIDTSFGVWVPASAGMTVFS
jgi:hypothetical protein